jgi:hypothetical protein
MARWAGARYRAKVLDTPGARTGTVGVEWLAGPLRGTTSRVHARQCRETGSGGLL